MEMPQTMSASPFSDIVVIRLRANCDDVSMQAYLGEVLVMEIPLGMYNEVFDTLLRDAVWGVYATASSVYERLGRSPPAFVLDVEASGSSWRIPYPNREEQSLQFGMYAFDTQMMSALYVEATGGYDGSGEVLHDWIRVREAGRVGCKEAR